jgi:hypothetical protein
LSFFSSVYSESDKEHLEEIAKEGRENFLPSSTDYFKSRCSLREKVSNWSHSKGFTVSTEGSSLWLVPAIRRAYSLFQGKKEEPCTRTQEEKS